MSFRVLGPLEVRVGGSCCPLGGTKPRLLLASLLLRPDTPVSVESLVEVLWPVAAPASATANVRTYVHTLRKRLPAVAERIDRTSGGYLLRTEPGELDATRFADLLARAAQAPAATQLALLTEAGDLWRGDVLTGLPAAASWAPVIGELTEQRLQAAQQRVELLIGQCRFEEAVPGLRGLVAEHPLREQLWQQLVRALDGAGRGGEAEQVYQQLRSTLHAELGTEPSVPLHALRPVPSRPCQLPLDLPDFTGREHLVHRLGERLRAAAAGNPAVVVLSGAPGTGKSTVAVHMAHLMREHFPDGQLYADLAAGGTAPSTMDILADMLRALGIPDARLPGTDQGRAGMLRAVLAERRVCLVLDDVATTRQVASLLPGAGASAVLLTSRGGLPDLPGATHHTVEAFTADEAAGLLERITGAQGAGYRDIARYCGQLPLAVRIAGLRLARRGRRGGATLAASLRDEQRRLSELRVGELDVRARLGSSYRMLGAPAATLLRGLGSLGTIRFPGWAASALLGGTDARHVLDELLDAHLVHADDGHACAEPRYRLPGLVRCYAVERRTEEPVDPRPVLDGYRWLAAVAAARMPINFFGIVPAAGSRPAGVADLADDPQDWFAAERQSCVTAVSIAAESGMDDLAWQLATACAPYFDLRGHQLDWLHTHRIALRSARRCADVRGEAIVLRNLAQLHLYADADTAAFEAFAESHRRFAGIGDDIGAATALSGLGTVYRVRGEHDAAMRHGERALRLFRAAGEPHGEAVALIAIGSVLLASGRQAEAEQHFHGARELAAEIGDRHREAHALKRLAMLRQQGGNLAAARELVDQAITIFTELGDDHCVGYANQHLGELCLRSGELAHARLLLVNSLRAHQRTGDRRSTAEVAELLGALHEALRQPERSAAYRLRASRIRAEFSAAAGSL